jgi:hypothetical protein
VVSTREERRQARIVRLLAAIQAAGATWAEAENQVGIATGRTGAVSAPLETIRGTAQRRFADVCAKLAAATTPPDDPDKPQHRLPLRRP